MYIRTLVYTYVYSVTVCSLWQECRSEANCTELVQLAPARTIEDAYYLLLTTYFRWLQPGQSKTVGPGVLGSGRSDEMRFHWRLQRGEALPPPWEALTTDYSLVASY